MEDEKIQFLRMHPAAEEIEDDKLREIAEHAELLRFKSSDMIHRSDDVLTSLYLIVQGRVKCEAKNLRGQTFMERIYPRGEQIGGLGAALAEPLAVEVTSYGPSVLLKFDYQDALELTLKHPLFRRNLSRLIARGIRQLVFGDKKRKKVKLVTIYHESPDGRELTVGLIKRLQELNETVCLFTDQSPPPKLSGVRSRLLTEGKQAPSFVELRRQIHEWSDTDRVFFDLRAGQDVLEVSDVLMSSEQVFWCIHPDEWSQAEKRLRRIAEITPVWREKISIVWLLDDEQTVVPVVEELKELALEDYKLSFNDPRPNWSKTLVNGLERIVHLLRGIRIGVALGGGAARGMAHLGVLKALEREGIVVDMLAGTSAGAMTGTVLALGMDYDYAIKCFVNDLTPSWVFRHMPKGDQWYLLYKYRRGHFDPMLRKYLGDTKIEQLPLPLRAITVDLITGRPVIRDTGDAVHAILESINLPVLSLPICREGRALVDGGLVNNVPANVLVEEGCNFVIAVSVTAKLEKQFGLNSPDTPTEKMKAPSTLQTILRSHVVQNVNMNSVGVQPADIVIEPDVTGFDLTAFTKTDQLAAIGEQATMAALPDIKKQLAKLDENLFC